MPNETASYYGANPHHLRKVLNKLLKLRSLGEGHPFLYDDIQAIVLKLNDQIQALSDKKQNSAPSDADIEEYAKEHGITALGIQGFKAGASWMKNRIVKNEPSCIYPQCRFGGHITQ